MEKQVVENGKSQKCRHQVDINGGLKMSQHHQEEEKDHEQHKAYLNLIEHRLNSKRQTQRTSSGGECIFKFLGNLGSICGGKFQRPHMISIGPYHRGKDHLVNYQDNKWHFLDKLLLRATPTSSKNLDFFLKEATKLEERTRDCYVHYGDVGPVSSYDFVEMILLDGCFIIELLCFIGNNEDGIDRNDDPIFTRPSAIPLLIADLLMLENQLPFFVLESLFKCSKTSRDEKELLSLIIESIQLFFPFPAKIPPTTHTPKHLLEFVYTSLSPKTYTTRTDLMPYRNKPYEVVQSVTQLRPSGIKFKPRKFVGLLDIMFKNGVLEIPMININNFTMNLITNCLAWEQCSKDAPTYFTDYIYFMNCLINGPRDVSLLCADGIITRHSRDDANVASYFNSLGKNIVVSNIKTSYLSKEMRDIEEYYCSNWATIMRTLTIHNRSSSSLP